jgi:hypothetical protein
MDKKTKYIVTQFIKAVREGKDHQTIEKEFESLKTDEALYTVLMGVRLSLLKGYGSVEANPTNKPDESVQIKNYALEIGLVDFLKELGVEVKLCIYQCTCKSLEWKEEPYEYFPISINARYLR